MAARNVVGKAFGTEEHVISTIEGTVARSFSVSVNPKKQWDIELFNIVCGFPWDSSGTKT